ncbi:MAG: hypothetical protein SRB1_02526 [Desulfobacteraceae bacterium Eth-SRB1]|nr:MAG: hypothetical protein SRB1_02526 [Desulfobacteraceae bacterium Eth-SRB1]
MKKKTFLMLVSLFVFFGLFFASPASASWTAGIMVERDDGTLAVKQAISHIGVDAAAETVPHPGMAVEQTVDIALYSPSWEKYFRDMREDGLTSYVWILGVNPKGNVGGPINYTATLSWNPAEFGAGDFELREGHDGTGAVVVADMKTTTSLNVTASGEILYSLIYTPAAVTAPEITAIQLGNTVSTDYFIAAAHQDMFSNGTVWVMPGQTQGSDSSTPPTGLSSATAPLNGVSSGWGGLLVGFSTADFTAIVADNSLPSQNMPTNANTSIFGGTQGPINKDYISLSRTGIVAGTTATLTVNMNNEVPHLVAVMGGSAPTVDYDSSGTGTLTITTTTFDSTNNANESFTSLFGFTIFTDSSFGSEPLGIIAQTNHWVGDIFPLLPGWDSNAAVGGGAKGTITAKCGTTIAGIPGQARNIRIFFPDSAIPEIFPSGTEPTELKAFVGSGTTHAEKPGESITRTTNFGGMPGNLAQFTYTFASAVDASVGLSACYKTVTLSLDPATGAYNFTTEAFVDMSAQPPQDFDISAVDLSWGNPPVEMGLESFQTIKAESFTDLCQVTADNIDHTGVTDGHISVAVGGFYSLVTPNWLSAVEVTAKDDTSVTFNYVKFERAGPPPEAPFAVAGADFTAIVDTEITLDGSASQGVATYSWTQTVGTTVTLTDANTVNPTFTPEATGEYTFQLIVNNGTEDSPPDTVTVTVVAAGTAEDTILTLYANLNAALQTYIGSPSTANLDAIMAFFSAVYLHDGENKADFRIELEQDLNEAISVTLYATNIQMIDETNASCFQTEVVEIYNQWGESFTDVESFTMFLVKEGDTWKIYGNQKEYDVWVETIASADETTTSYKLEFGLEVDPDEVSSVTVTGPAITGDPVSLFDDGMHHDFQPNDGEWANVISLASAPTVGDIYTFNINLAAGGDPVQVTAVVSGIMSSFASNGTVSEQMPPIASWDASTGAVFYAVQLFDEYGAMVWEMWGIPTPFVEYMGPPLFAGKEYQWKVLSFDANENVSVSEFFTFTVTFGPEGGDKTISGTVYEPDGTTPIPNIWVNAWSDSAMFGFGAQTDVDGNYTISNLVAASDYKVDVWSENYAHQHFKKADDCTLSAPVDGVVDYSACGIPPVGTSDWMQATQVDLFANSASGVNFVMSAGVSISGSVKDDAENGIGRVWVNAWSESSGGCGGTETDVNGNYTIPGLVVATDYRVEIQDDQYAHQFYMYTGYAPGDAAPAGNDYSALTAVGTTIWDQATLVATSDGAAATGVNFIVAEGKSISGLVLAGGTPVSNVWVNAWSDSAMTGNGAQTDQNGEYTIHGLVPAFDYRVDMWHESYTYQVYDGKTDWMNADFVDITINDAVSINLNLSAGNSISGRVTDETGTGIAGVWVNAYSDSTWFGRGESTNANGEYTISGLAAASDYRVDVWKEGWPSQFYDGQNDWMQADLVDVTGGSVGNINFTLSAGVSISGTITLPDDATETDYRDCWVSAWSESTGFGCGAPVNTDGTYVIAGLASASDYKIDVWSYEYGQKFYSDTNPNGTSDWMQATPVDVTDGTADDTINITLSGGSSISGTISGLAEGDWVWVNAWSELNMCGNGTEINGIAGGGDVTYTIRGLEPAADYKVDINSDKYENQFYADPVVVTADTPATEINFTLSAGVTISGTVTIDGQGVAYIWIDAWSETGSWGGANTDSDGNFTIGGLKANTIYNVNIWHPDYANQSATVTTETSGSAAVEVSFTLGSGYSISGTVTVGVTPVQNAWVNAWSDSEMTGRSEPTDASGNYVIKGLAPADDYRVDVWVEDYASQFYDGVTMWDQATLVDIKGASQEGIDFSLSAGSSIKGTVTVPSGGNKNDLWVNAWSDTAGGMGAPVNNWNGDVGTYEITGLVPATDYKVDIWSPDYQHVFYNGVSDWMLATEVIVVESGDTEGINFVLSAGKTISGTVTVPEGGNLSNLWVNAWSDTAGSWGGSVVAGDGTYEITGLADASDFVVDIWSEEFGYQVYNGKRNWEDADRVSTAGGNIGDINFTLTAGKLISGRITDTNDNGIANAWVNVWSDSGRCGRGEPTDQDGNFIIKGIDAFSDYKLDVWSEEYGYVLYKDALPNNTTGDWMQATAIDVTTDNATGINMKLSEGCTIYGNVRNVSGDPIQYAWVNAWCDAGGNGAETDASGNYVIKGLPSSDSYKVDVWTEAYVHMFYDGVTDWGAANTVDVSSGSAVDIDFVLSSGNSITGTVKTGDTPLADIWVNAWSETAGCWGGASTNSSGVYTIGGLAPASDYVVDIWSDTYAHQFYNGKTDWMDATRVDVSGGDATGINFNLSSGNYISGTITLPEGSTDYYNVWVNAWSDTAMSGNGCPVKYDGTYKIAGLIPGGGYKLDVWSEEYVHVFYQDGATNNSTTDWANATEIDISSASGNATEKNLTLGSGLSITGTVELSGVGKANIWVDAWSPTTWTWGGAETDSDGNFTINGLLAGTDYVVSTWSWEYMNASQSGVSTGDTVDLILSAGVSISGNLHNDDDAGLGGVWVDAWSSDLGVGNWAMTSGTGNIGDFIITGLKPNTTYTVSAATGNHGFISKDVVVGAVSVAGVDLHIKTGFSISGTVTKASDAQFIDDVEVIVAAFDTSDGTFHNSTTASAVDGTYTLTNLPNDKSFKIVVKAAGYTDMWHDGAATYVDASQIAYVDADVENIDFSLVAE